MAATTFEAQVLKEIDLLEAAAASDAQAPRALTPANDEAFRCAAKVEGGVEDSENGRSRLRVAAAFETRSLEAALTP